MADIPAIAGSDTGTWKSLVNAVIALINGKFNSRPYIWANDSARTTFLATAAGVIGEYGYQTDTQTTYRLTSTTTAVAWESPWITYTPTVANVAVGTGGSALSAAAYRYVGGVVEVDIRLILGTSGQSVGSTPTLTLPITARALTHTNMVFPGFGSIQDTSTSDLRVAFVQATTTTVVRFAHITPSGIGFAVPTATVPWTWAAGDSFQVRFNYVPA
jgi:hypothetical protein